MSNITELMQETFLAHQEFKNEWKKWRNGKLKKNKKYKGIKKNKRNIEPDTVKLARNHSHKKVAVLYDSKLIPLELKFRESPKLALNEVLEFLSADITAFRTGYVKEIFLQKLKNIELSNTEKAKVQQVALGICKNENIRREFRRWCRLMIKYADVKFLNELHKLLESEKLFVRLKSEWMIKAIQSNRLDLRESR